MRLSNQTVTLLMIPARSLDLLGLSGVQAWGEERGAMATTGVRHVLRKKFSFLGETGVSTGECFPAEYILKSWIKFVTLNYFSTVSPLI